MTDPLTRTPPPSTVIRGRSRMRALACAALVGLAASGATAQRVPTTPAMADYIVAIVNQELVTNAELQARLLRVRAEAERGKLKLPPEDELRKQVLDALIDERVLITNARESGPRIDEAELDRAVANVAVQNQMTMPQLRTRLQQQGMSYATFRGNVRDQMQVERAREHDVNALIKISTDEVDALIEERRKAAGNASQLNIAQILITVPDNASTELLAQRKAIADAALLRVKAGEDFGAVARELSQDGNKAQGGVIGLRAADRLPDLFVEAVKPLAPGEFTPTLLRSGAGFHILKLIERQQASAFTVQQTQARHILLRISDQLTAEAATRRLSGFKRLIEGGRPFEQLAKENSEDGSAAAGGDLGWTDPGTFVPEFEQAMAALAINGISEPVVSRFGVHLIQVVGRRERTLDLKQQREQARNVLREQKFDGAYAEWVRDLRGKAYIEYREPPL